MPTFASSDPETTSLSSKGLQSVSRTAAVWPRKRGSLSGSLPRSSTGMTAKAPPPPASQLTAIYFGFAFDCMSVDLSVDVRLAYLDQVGIPGILSNSEVVITLIL